VPSEPPVRPALPRRDRIAVLTALVGVTALAWVYLWILAVRMESMDMGAMAIRPWSVVDFALMFAMWAVMMVGMMVPSATPITLVYAAVARKAEGQGTPVAPTFCFVAGYVAAWTFFSAMATIAQWALDQAALLSPRMVSSSSWLGAAVLVAAGVYQMTPAKSACLEHCRAPAHFIAQHWRPGAAGAFRMGLVHGAFCLGCCWALMGLLFVGGVMNLLWIAAIMLFVLGEKLLPWGGHAGRWSGVAMIAAGIGMVVGPWMAAG
jgi:predicted metal-binding membrane protein